VCCASVAWMPLFVKSIAAVTVGRKLSVRAVVV
jgi:hypothetical protein